MSGIDWWLVYWVGVAIYGTSLVEKLEVIDILASYLSALLWPIGLPARLLRRILK